ncbi:MAG: insulinase family protein [Anaerolineaceae bacterium]|nr:insulinase family protein [Anaerolineaceae bacterium]
MEKNSFKRVTLKNGLVVLLKEIHTVPLVSNWLWYRVGSRNERQGLTGISHWVEHMQFKGTELFPAGVLDKAISRDGGFWNAMTYLDWTAYFETMPADKVDLGFQLEADRMIHSFYDLEEVESERSVIISELEGGKNSPLTRLNEAVQQHCFDLHPYRNEVIGSVEDLRSITRDDLFSHYRSFYNPRNAVVAVAGDFKTDSVLRRIEELFGDIPGSALAEEPIELEAPLNEERRVDVEGPGETAYLLVAYRAPRANSRDFFILTLLDSILSGPTSLNLFSAGITNRTSRLYDKLVMGNQAVSVFGSLSATIDPYIYDVLVTIHPQSSHEAVLALFDEEVDRLQNELISMDEVRQAVKQQRALFAYGSENITNQAFWMGFSEMFAQYEWFERFIDEINSVTPDELQRVAQEYLQPARRVVGRYLPVNEMEPEGGEA